MTMAKPAKFEFPIAGATRGPGFWANPANWIAARKKFRRDHTVVWRQRYEENVPATPDRSTDYRELIGRAAGTGFTFLILGDTGEGDRSQHGLLPLIRALKPDFMVINGDVAYPAGRESDFLEGFFQPYQNLRIPIWAVPGNHEYYSPHNGQEFFDVFCTTKHARLWSDNGLRFVRQPGTYWELSAADCPLVVLALDSGMTATLDPAQKWFGLSKSDGDAAQLSWLERRLAVAAAHGKRALVLFHIPSLVNLKKAREPKLDRLHSILGRYAGTVTGIVTAHEHCFQHYEPEVFAKFVSGGAKPGPHYFVSGSGGAYLSAVNFKNNSGQFQARRLFPNRAQWRAFAGKVKAAASAPGHSNVFFRAVSAFSDDQDLARFQSLLQVRVERDPGSGRLNASMIPYFQNSLEDLYKDQNDVTVIVRDGSPAPTPEALETLTRDDPADSTTAVRFEL
jgi:hypothetical protein